MHCMFVTKYEFQATREYYSHFTTITILILSLIIHKAISLIEICLVLISQIHILILKDKFL